MMVSFQDASWFVVYLQENMRPLWCDPGILCNSIFERKRGLYSVFSNEGWQHKNRLSKYQWQSNIENIQYTPKLFPYYNIYRRHFAGIRNIKGIDQSTKKPNKKQKTNVLTTYKIVKHRKVHKRCKCFEHIK